MGRKAKVKQERAITPAVTEVTVLSGGGAEKRDQNVSLRPPYMEKPGSPKPATSS